MQVEGDSLLMKKALLHNQFRPPWNVHQILQDCRQLLSSSTKWEARHRFREANRLADLLAKEASSMSKKKFHENMYLWLNCVPPFLAETLSVDGCDSQNPCKDIPSFVMPSGNFVLPIL